MRPLEREVEWAGGELTVAAPTATGAFAGASFTTVLSAAVGAS